jgi:tetratricopeptide (TPR) repeat protein
MAGNKEAFQKAMNQGTSAAWDQEWDKAAGFYSAALREFPENTQALSSMGLALFELKDYPASLQCYQKLAMLSPEDPAAQEKIARIYEFMGRLNDAISASLHAAEIHLKARSAEKAIDNWNRVLSLQPDNITVRSRLAAVYEKLGRKEDASNEFVSVASLYQQSGDLTRAVKVLEYSIMLLPENQELRMALSMLRSNQRLPQPMRPRGGTGPVAMEKVVKQKETPVFAPGPEETGQSKSDEDPLTEARQQALIQLAAMLFEQAEEGAQSASRGRGLNALARGLVGESSEGNDRSRINLHLNQAIASQTVNDNNQAVIELEHALNLGLRLPAAYYDLGLLLKDSNSDKALRYLLQSVKNPEYALASHLLIGQIYEKKTMWREAAVSFLHALELADGEVTGQADNEEFLSQYDTLVDTQNSIEDSVVLSKTCKSIANQLIRPNWRVYLLKARENLPPPPEGAPPTPVAHIIMDFSDAGALDKMAQVRQLAADGKVRSALEEALYAVQSAPYSLPLHVLIGELMLQDDHPIEAVHKLQVVARLYTIRGEANQAIRLLRRISQINPSDLNTRQQIIDLLVAQDKTEDALKEYQSLADLFYTMADLDKARQTYLDALKVAQKSKDNRVWGVTLLMKVADIDLQRLNLRQALRIFEQIRTIQLDNHDVRTQLVNLNFRLGQEQAGMKELDDYTNFLEGQNRRKEAIDFVNEILAENEKRLDLRRRLADLLLRDGQKEKAVEELDFLADTLLNEGKTFEAINMLELIVSLNPPNVADYRTALDTVRRDSLRR